MAMLVLVVISQSARTTILSILLVPLIIERAIYGEGGIRTPVKFDPKIVFETTAFNHSATSPRQHQATELFY